SKNKKNKNFDIFYPNSFYSKNSIRIRSMVITAMMLSLYIIFAWLGNQFFNLAFLANFLNLDISLLFLIPLVFICNWRWWLFAAIMGGVSTFMYAGAGVWIGAVYNIVLNLVTLSFIYLLKIFIVDNNYFLKRAKDKKNNLLKVFFKFEFQAGLIAVITFIFSVFINCLLNGLIFTPLYMNLYLNNIFPNAWFIDVENIYNSSSGQEARWFLLFIPNYWTGIFALYSAFNAIKFGIVLILIYPVLLLLFKTNLASDYFGINKTNNKKSIIKN
ncbi:MAG: hypothetical protein K2K18_01930, partial [Malacoplasma sp.]|nr:hypothetical protein [Malacoplasma sp.]